MLIHSDQAPPQVRGGSRETNPESRKFWCANLGEWESVEHLDLDKHGRTGGGGYVRAIERVYTLHKQSAAQLKRAAGKHEQSTAKKLRYE